MVLENTKENRKLADAMASLAIENMYVSEDYVKELIKVQNGEKTYDQLVQEVIREYARQ